MWLNSLSVMSADITQSSRVIIGGFSESLPKTHVHKIRASVLSTASLCVSDMGVSGTKHLPDDSFTTPSDGRVENHIPSADMTADSCVDSGRDLKMTSPSTPDTLSPSKTMTDAVNGAAVTSLTHCSCGHCHMPQYDGGWEDCHSTPSSSSSPPPSPSKTSSTGADDPRMLQADWCALRHAVRQFYWLHLGSHTSTVAASVALSLSTPDGDTAAGAEQENSPDAVSKQLHPLFKERVVRLCQRDPHQLFVRLNGQLLEVAGEIRSQLLRQLAGGGGDQQLSLPPAAQLLPEAFVGDLLQHHERMMMAATSMSPALHALQRCYLSRFGLSWKSLNEYAYHSIVYMEPAVQNNLPAMLALLQTSIADQCIPNQTASPTSIMSVPSSSSSSSTPSSSYWSSCCPRSEFMHRYLDFVAQMKAAAQLWSRAETRLHEFGQQEVARRAKIRLMRHAGDLRVDQATDDASIVVEQTDARSTAAVTDRAKCPGEASFHGDNSLAASAASSAPSVTTVSAVKTTTMTSVSTTTSSSSVTTVSTTVTTVEKNGMCTFSEGESVVRCTSRTCCSKKNIAASQSASAGCAAPLTPNGSVSSNGATSRRAHNYGGSGRPGSHAQLTNHCPELKGGVECTGHCAAAVASAGSVTHENDSESCSGQSTSSQQHCCCCCCELFGHGAVNQAPVSRNYPEIRDRLRLRLNQRRRHDTSTAACSGDSTSSERAQVPRDDRDLSDLVQYIEASGENRTGHGCGQRNEKRAAKRERQRQKRLEQRLANECHLEQMRSIEDFQRRNPEVTITVVKSSSSSLSPSQSPAVQSVAQHPVGVMSRASHEAEITRTRTVTAKSSKTTVPPQPAVANVDSMPTIPISSASVSNVVDGQATKRSSLLESLSNSGFTEGEASQNNVDTRMVTIRRVMEPGGGEPKVTITLKGDSPDKDRVLMTLVNGQMCDNEKSKPDDIDKCITKTAKKKLKKALKLQKMKEEEEAAERARQEAIRAAEEAQRQQELAEQKRLEQQQLKKNKKKKNKSETVQLTNGNKSGVKAVPTAAINGGPVKSERTAKTADNRVAQSKLNAQITSDKSLLKTNANSQSRASVSNSARTLHMNGSTATSKNKEQVKRCDAGVQSTVALDPPTQLMQDLTLSSDSEIEEIARAYRIPVGISITRVPPSSKSGSSAIHPPSSVTLQPGNAGSAPGRLCNGVAPGPTVGNDCLAAPISTVVGGEHDSKGVTTNGDHCFDQNGGESKKSAKKRRRKKKQTAEDTSFTPNVTISKVENRGCRAVDDFESVFMPSAGGVTDSVDQEVEAFKRFCLDSPQVNREHRPKVNLNIKDIFIKMKPS